MRLMSSQCDTKWTQTKPLPKVRVWQNLSNLNFTSSQSPSRPGPHWFGRDIWKRYCYKKHTQRRLLCASRPRLTSLCVGKCTLSLTSRAFMVRGANAGYRPLSPLLQKTLTAPQRPADPHNLSNTRQGGGPNEVWDHPARRATLLFISSSTPNSPENGPFNNSGVGRGVVAASVIRTYVHNIKTKVTVKH